MFILKKKKILFSLPRFRKPVSRAINSQGHNLYKLSAGSVNFHAKLKIHSTWVSTDLDEIYTVCRLYRVYSIPKIFLKTIT